MDAGWWWMRVVQLRQVVWIVVLLAVAGSAWSQQVPQPAAEADVTAVAPAASADSNVTTLGEVRAVPPDEAPPLDLYGFKNPVTVEPNRFDKAYRPPPTPEQVSTSGGYLMLGVYYALGAAAQGLHKLSGGRDQIQSAVARPPPLTEDQMRRAATMCSTSGERCAGQ